MPRIVPLSSEKLRKVFERKGFKCARIEGDHYIYTKHGVIRPVVIPQRKEVPVFIIKNNLRTGCISREEYFSILEKLL
ncbi:MAG: type II toxin-antitoxin system HicA family toxin [Nitrospirae bacterium]|nr:type II toxin-antitoxin system HicA family toxin [Nitrospirota bacterium]